MQAEPPNGAELDLRVLQVGPLYVNHVRRWAENCAALGCTVFAAGHLRAGRQPVDLSDVAEHTEIAPAQLWSRGAARRVAWLRDVIRSVEPDLVQAHWLPSWGYFASHAGHRPLVVTPWGSDLYRATGAERRRTDLALNAADRVLARSPHMLRELLARGVPAERIDAVDLGVDLEGFRPAPEEERTELRRDQGLPAGPVILSPRAGTALYNLDVVLDAFSILRGRFGDATLLLIHGDAPLSRAVRTSLHGRRETDGVRAVGRIPHAELPKYMQAATAGVSIPSSDGSPSSVWEALACGLPMVLSDLPQVGERVGRSGAVRLVEPRPEEVASALTEIVANPALRDRMAAAARDWAIEHADEREQIDRLGRAYAATAKRPAARQPAQPSPVR